MIEKLKARNFQIFDFTFAANSLEIPLDKFLWDFWLDLLPVA